MLTSYFESVPKALDEAALVDGCGPVRALFRVVLPAALPGIIAVTIYAFMTAWGEVLFASVMTNNTTRTLAVGLADYSTENNVYWNQIMAAPRSRRCTTGTCRRCCRTGAAGPNARRRCGSPITPPWWPACSATG